MHPQHSTVFYHPVKNQQSDKPSITALEDLTTAKEDDAFVMEFQEEFLTHDIILKSCYSRNFFKIRIDGLILSPKELEMSFSYTALPPEIYDDIRSLVSIDSCGIIGVSVDRPGFAVRSTEYHFVMASS